MIRAALPRPDGTTTVLIGLSRDNVHRGQAGMPVRATLEVLHLTEVPHDVVIVFGDTEADIVTSLRQAGLVLPAAFTMPPAATA